MNPNAEKEAKTIILAASSMLALRTFLGGLGWQ
jgi:hypothetical protein